MYENKNIVPVNIVLEICVDLLCEIFYNSAFGKALCPLKWLTNLTRLHQVLREARKHFLLKQMLHPDFVKYSLVRPTTSKTIEKVFNKR